VIRPIPARIAVFGLLLVAGCKWPWAPASIDWVRFNGDDQVDVEVTADPEPGDPVSIDLTSTTGAVVIGTATVDPGSGPVGTDHVVTVLVDEAYSGDVGRVVVSTDAGSRGVEDHTLQQDSADHGLWVRTLTSQGAEGEERTDTFTFELFTVGDATVSDTDQ